MAEAVGEGTEEDELELLRSVVRKLDIKPTSLAMNGNHHYTGRGYLSPEQRSAVFRAYHHD